jgi:hypothetical protein
VSTGLEVPSLPLGAEPWLEGFLTAAAAENVLLRRNGATGQAQARESLLALLVEHAEGWYNTLINVREAARTLDCSEETVRRKVRSGVLLDQRRQPSGPHEVRRGDVAALTQERNKKYDLDADARSIAKLRSTAA